VSDNPARKTAFDLVAVYKNGVLINMDSQTPNAVFGEWVRGSGYFGELTLIRPECTWGDSRFDFYLETHDERIFVEVKGVTLEEDGVVRFPDAPSERGIKHLRELARARENGYAAYVFFVIQMESCRYFEPNEATHAAFAAALREAAEAGVGVRAVCCRVEEDLLEISDFAEVRL
jgi:sugar fermentation stimulation protein A